MEYLSRGTMDAAISVAAAGEKAAGIEMKLYFLLNCLPGLFYEICPSGGIVELFGQLLH